MFLFPSKNVFSTNVESFNSVLCLDGNAEITYKNEKFPLVKGDSYFIPANMGDYSIEGKAQVIVSKI
jgi:mannose-6-phosphate isomerase